MTKANKKWIILGGLLILSIGITIVLAYVNREKPYTINILHLEDITTVKIDDLTLEDNVTEYHDQDIIEELYHIFYNKTTNEESTTLNPEYPDILYIVTFSDQEGNSTSMYIYTREENYYIEQSYNGIYKSSKEEFECVEKYVD